MRFLSEIISDTIGFLISDGHFFTKRLQKNVLILLTDISRYLSHMQTDMLTACPFTISFFSYTVRDKSFSTPYDLYIPVVN